LGYWDFLWDIYHALCRLFGVLAVLMAIIVVHEMGHYLVGRWCGIKAAVFSAGFGPEIWARIDKNGTRWRLAAVPLGGYVRFLGDDEVDSRPATEKTRYHLPAGSFAAANAWQRAATIIAGPFFNALLTVLILAFMAFYFGKFTVSPVVSRVLPHSPAAVGGLQAGDRFLTINGEAIGSFEDIARYIMLHDSGAVQFEVERQGRPVAITVFPKMERVDDGFGNIIHVGRIGIVGSNSPENIRKKAYTIGAALQEGMRDTGFVVQQTGRYLGKLLQGRADRCQLSGPVRTAQIAWKVSDIGVWALVQLAAFLSIGIGLFNLLPLPPLDGGHLLFYLIEGVTGYAVPARAQETVFRAGWVIILLFTVFAILNNYIPC